MSCIKRELERIESQGYNDIKKNICWHCTNEKYFIKVIKNDGFVGKCDYCKRKNIKVLPMNSIMDIIMDVINEDYQRAEDYPGLDLDIPSYDMIYNEFSDMLQIDSVDILDDMANSLKNTYVSNEALWGNYEIEEFDDEWYKYIQIVNSSKYEVSQILSLGKKKNPPHNIIDIIEYLDYFYEVLKKHQVNTYIKPQDNIYRAVNYIANLNNYGIDYYPATLLGTAPTNCAADNRMSVKGEMVFYGSNNINTSITELGEKKTENPTIIGCFNLNKKMKIMNLTRVPRMHFPSYFDLSQRPKYNECRIINELANEVSRPISNNDKKSGYKHLQLLANYMYMYHNIKGVAFLSSKDEKGICYALFIDNNNCIDEDDAVNNNTHQLILKDVNVKYI